MPRKIDTSAYNEAEHEQDSRKMMEHINQRKDTQEAEDKAREAKYMADREKARRNAIACYIARGTFAAIAFCLIGIAMTADFIAPVLAIPATYICTGYFGWCLCKVIGKFRKGAVKR